MDLLYALIVWLIPREAVPTPPAPLELRPGTVQTIPDPLPYTLDEWTWGP